MRAEVSKRLKVLISAYACEPGKGSEPYVGWNAPLHVARHHDVWLLTRANNRALIEAELKETPAPNLHMVYFDLPQWTKFWKKGNRGIHLYYYLWQVGAYFVANRLHRKVGFDVAHHLTFGIDWLPSFLAFLPVPFVWGPIVGAQSASTTFRRMFSWGAKIQESAHFWTRRITRIDPLVRWAARRTAIAVASGVQVRDQLRSLGCRRVLIYPSVGISRTEIEHLSPQPRELNGQLRFLCVGDLYAFRAFSLTLKAFASVRKHIPHAELWIVGDGPERARLVKQTEILGAADVVKFWGTIPRQELLPLLSNCHVLVYPCLRGAISMACLEAMAAGLPVICLDLGGSALQVNEESGIKVRALSPNQVTEDLTHAMLRLGEDANLRRRIGDAARRRVEDEFCWEAKALHLCEMYREALIVAGSAQ